jgi:hypothetical protein
MARTCNPDGAFPMEYWFVDYRVRRPFPPSPACHPRQSSHALLHSAALVVTAQESAKRNPKSVGGEARSTRFTDGLVNTGPKWLLPGGCGVQRKINGRVQLLAGWITTCVLLFSLCVAVHGGFPKGDVDFSNYDVPLYQQIVNRIKAKGAPRLGEGENKKDRYFIVAFAYQNKRNNPEFSHSFISVIHLLPEGKQPGLRSGFRRGSFKAGILKHLQSAGCLTISILIRIFAFSMSSGGRLFATRNKCPISVGRNFRLDETLKLAVNAKCCGYVGTLRGQERGI